jgi:hypothetical protein
VPCQEWLDTIEVMCNEILGNYSKKEDQLMTAAFSTHPKRRLNRVMDAIGFEYPDYEQLDKGAKGQKRKRVASALNKDDEDQPKKKKQEFEAKKQVFYFVGASSEKFTPSAEDLPGAFEHIEGEINDLDKVIAGHGDFYALVASRGTTVAFLKSGCEHGKVVNRPNFSLSPADLDNIPNLARSIANRFIKLVWIKGGQSKAGDEARSHLKLVTKSYLMLTFSFEF